MIIKPWVMRCGNWVRANAVEAVVLAMVALKVLGGQSEPARPASIRGVPTVAVVVGAPERAPERRHAARMVLVTGAHAASTVPGLLVDPTSQVTAPTSGAECPRRRHRPVTHAPRAGTGPQERAAAPTNGPLPAHAS
jgi:hypothetical protein